MRPSPRRTKIVATIGPASSSEEMLGRIIDVGIDGARLNFSHGRHDDHAENARRVRSAQSAAGRPIALIADLQGPKLRVGELPQRITLTKDEEIVVSGEDGSQADDLPVLPAVLGSVLQPGHDVLIDDGLVKLRVERVEAGRALCRVVTGGPVESHKGVNVPGVALPVPSLTAKDLADLELAVDLGVDYVAQSFVRSRADVAALRARLEVSGSEAWVIAKIELKEAVDAIEEILDEADAVMIARGDLGVEIGAAEVPLLQKRIILSALDRGKPAITATQMLESMVQAVQTMDRIACAIEPSLGYRHQLPSAAEEPTVGRAMSNAACDLAEALGAKAILVPTFTGRTASAVARLRPQRPILALTHINVSLQHMAIEWGVTPLGIPESSDVEDLWARSLEAARASGLVEAGDRVVLTAGTAVNIPGSTNVIKVDTA
jgi:pyruvate kinase